MENPNATWNEFSTGIIQRDVSYQVSSNFLNQDEQTKVQLVSLGQELKNLRSKLQNIESTHWKTHDNPILSKRAEKMLLLQSIATIAVPMETLQTGVKK